MPKSKTVVAPKIGRDKRVDRLGLCKVIEKHLGDSLRKSVRADMQLGRLTLAKGDAYGATLKPVRETWIDARGFFKLYESGQITLAKFLSAISVPKSAAEVVLSKEQMDKLERSAPGTPKMMIEPLDGVELDLPTAAARLIELLREDTAPAKAAA